MRQCHETLTGRLLLRSPRRDDVNSIFQCYASDKEVTRYVGWPRHERLEDTEAFIDFSTEQWQTWPIGPLSIYLKQTGELIGSTGLAFESPTAASTGYVLGRKFWGFGYASEALSAVVALARSSPIERLYALCHAEHAASIGVLERCDFQFERLLARHLIFPNLGVATPQDVRCFALARQVSA